MDWKDVLGKVLIIQFMYALATYLVDNSFKNWLNFIAIPIIFTFLVIAVFSGLGKK
jgi:3-phenylpropionate/cinnamic acid dioxygenase small subunit